MSERAAAAGKDGVPHTIEHAGKTYVIQPVLTEGVMRRVEEALYERQKAALASLRGIMGEEQYERKLDELLQRYLDEEFKFESPQTLEYMKTRGGAILLLECMMGAPKAELIALFVAKPVEVRNALKTVLALSMPKGSEVEVGVSPEDEAAEAPKAPKRRRRA